jgi:hypothetical protein
VDNFKCYCCGREQSYAPADESGGVTQKEAESLGWALIDGKWWICPVCNPALAEHDVEIFVQDNRGNKACRELCFVRFRS